MKITQLLRSGKVTRWHSNPEMNHCRENLAEHQWTTACVLLWLDPEVSRDAIIACLRHDVGELIAGDLSYDFKIAQPVMAATHGAIEAQARNEIVSDMRVTPAERELIKLSDRIAAWDAMCHHRPGLRHTASWRKEINAIWALAHCIDSALGSKVKALFAERHAVLTEMCE